MDPRLKAAWWRLAWTILRALPGFVLLGFVLWVWFDVSAAVLGKTQPRWFGAQCVVVGWVLGAWFGGVAGWTLHEGWPRLRDAFLEYRAACRAEREPSYPGDRPQLQRPLPPPPPKTPRGQA